MQARPLGPTGTSVGRLGLGTMTWGRGTDPAEAERQLLDFAAAGGTLVDTADVYGEGAAEEILGSLLEDPGLRRDLVVATKAGLRRSDPRGERRHDLSRRHLMAALEGSLERLGTAYVDLWQVHVWDPATPLEETLSVLGWAVDSGRARYVGVSNFCGWQLGAVAAKASARGLAMATVQVEYSLLQRGAEREVVPGAEALGVGVLPWAPLGRGVLTGKYRHGTPPVSRGASETLGATVREYLDAPHRRVVDAVVLAAEGLGVTPTEVALAWVRDRPGVVAPVVGARTAQQLGAALASESLDLPQEIRGALDDVSAPILGYPDHGWHQQRTGPSTG
ncbi:MAG: aldo/keto reductase [bacterium]